jgi:hypothetical protein
MKTRIALAAIFIAALFGIMFAPRSSDVAIAQQAAGNGSGNATPIAYPTDASGNLKANVVAPTGVPLYTAGPGEAASNPPALPVNANEQGWCYGCSTPGPVPIDVDTNGKVVTETTNPCSYGTLVNVVVNVSTATTTQLEALSSGKTIYVCKVVLLANGTGNATLEYGTGTTCGTGTTTLTGPMPLGAQAGWVEPAGTTPNYTTAASNALCLLTSAAVQVSGSIQVVQQ